MSRSNKVEDSSQIGLLSDVFRTLFIQAPKKEVKRPLNGRFSYIQPVFRVKDGPKYPTKKSVRFDEKIRTYDPKGSGKTEKLKTKQSSETAAGRLKNFKLSNLVLEWMWLDTYDFRNDEPIKQLELRNFEGRKKLRCRIASRNFQNNGDLKNHSLHRAGYDRKVFLVREKDWYGLRKLNAQVNKYGREMMKRRNRPGIWKFLSTMNQSSCIRGQIVVARSSKSRRFYRARIEELYPREKRARVYYPDSGKDDVVLMEEILMLPKIFAGLPFTALRCRLMPGSEGLDAWQGTVPRPAQRSWQDTLTRGGLAQDGTAGNYGSSGGRWRGGYEGWREYGNSPDISFSGSVSQSSLREDGKAFSANKTVIAEFLGQKRGEYLVKLANEYEPDTSSDEDGLGWNTLDRVEYGTFQGYRNLIS